MPTKTSLLIACETVSEIEYLYSFAQSIFPTQSHLWDMYVDQHKGSLPADVFDTIINVSIDICCEGKSTALYINQILFNFPFEERLSQWTTPFFHKDGCYFSMALLRHSSLVSILRL